MQKDPGGIRSPTRPSVEHEVCGDKLDGQKRSRPLDRGAHGDDVRRSEDCAIAPQPVCQKGEGYWVCHAGNRGLGGSQQDELAGQLGLVKTICQLRNLPPKKVCGHSAGGHLFSSAAGSIFR